jgi:mRNA deadenylase 3'-5' endonuclease subunit Ccr4
MLMQQRKESRNSHVMPKSNKRTYCSSNNDQLAGRGPTAAPASEDSISMDYSVEESQRVTGGVKRFNWRDVPKAERLTGTFKVASYNIMAESYSEPGPGRITVQKPVVQGRLSLILKDLEMLGSDIMCLQEVEAGLVDSQIRPFLHKKGFDFEYHVRSRANDSLTPDHWKPRVDGLLIAWRTAKFNKLSYSNFELRQMLFEHSQKWGVERKMLQDLLRLDNPVSIAMLETTHVKASKKLVCIANTHGYSGGEHGKPAMNVIQTQLALHAVRKAMYQHLGMNPKKVEADAPSPFPLIFAGDFNHRPGSGSYQLMASGHLPADSTWLNYSPGKPCTAVDMTHYLQLKSAYGASPFGEPRNTYYSSVGMHGTLDYVWYTPETLQVHKLLELPDLTSRPSLRLPCLEFPSDHFPIGAEFSFSPTPLPDPLSTPQPPVYVQTDYVPRNTNEKPKMFPKIKKQKEGNPLNPNHFDDFDPKELRSSTPIKPARKHGRSKK